jgi:hypothetical protein
MEAVGIDPLAHFLEQHLPVCHALGQTDPVTHLVPAGDQKVGLRAPAHQLGKRAHEDMKTSIGLQVAHAERDDLVVR